MLLVSIILAMVAAGLAALATAVQVSSEHHRSLGRALQHGRVAIERIQRTLNEATANEFFPGFFVVRNGSDRGEFPDAFVVWHPEGPPSNPAGMPLMRELVVYTPGVTQPNELLELTTPSDDRQAPPTSDLASWKREVDGMTASRTTRRVVLTNLLRVAVPAGASIADRRPRGAVRFSVRLRPAETEWTEFLAGQRSWEAISWAQGLTGPNRGLRQAWCRMELHLRAGPPDGDTNASVVPVFGSGAVYFPLLREGPGR
jgi:hypothetical protein